MSTSARLKRTAVLFAAAVVAVASLALPAGAHALKGADKAERKAHARSHVEHGKSRAATAKAKVAAKKVQKSNAKRDAAKARRDARKAARAARFVAAGTFQGSDGDVFGVSVTGSNRSALRHSDQVFVLGPDAVVKKDDVVVTLAELVTGDDVNVKGTRAEDGSLVVHRVNAATPEVDQDPEDVIVTDPAVE